MSYCEIDSFETFLEQEIGIAERVKEQLSDSIMRMAYVGQIAAFKASLECYRRYKALERAQNPGEYAAIGSGEIAAGTYDYLAIFQWRENPKLAEAKSNLVSYLPKCEHCGTSIRRGSIACQECCEHGDVCMDDRICLDCDKDMTEHLAAQAEWYSDLREGR